MVAEWVALLVLLFVASMEYLHARRVRALAALAFGPSRRPEMWVKGVPYARVAAATLLAWGLTALLFVPAKVFKAEELTIDRERHMLLVLDVSPSMRLVDAGPSTKQSRMQRARDLMESFFRRVPMAEYKSSVVAVYSEAKPVVVESRDLNIIRNILNDLPMHYAFRPGKTDLLAGLNEAARIARPWRPKSATLLVISDGDTIPGRGMPKMPASIADTVVVGVGDPVTGKFIDGGQSRQNRSALRQMAVRLHGHYHDGNEKHLPTNLLQQLTRKSEGPSLDKLTRREYALLACGFGAFLLALLPMLLHYFGTSWMPGVPLSLSRAKEEKQTEGVIQG